jgi:hypothetical protein
MKAYGNLVVRGSERALEDFIVALEKRHAGGWTRHHKREAEVSTAALGKMYCFACTADGARPACELWLRMHSDDSLDVSNILPQESPSLTYDQYNSVLSDFYRTCAEPAAKDVGVDVEFGNADLRLEDFVSAKTAKLLRSFSTLANRSILHPLDRERWNEFLASAYREGAKLDPSLLKRWLIEEEKWPEDDAITLAIEYEHARDLLQVFQSQA